MRVILSLMGIIFASSALASENPIEVVSRADYGVSELLRGNLGEKFLLCQGEDFPVQFKIAYGGEPGLVQLTVLQNLEVVVKDAVLQIREGSGLHGTHYDEKRDYGYASFIERNPSTTIPLRFRIELTRINLAVELSDTGLSAGSRQISLSGQQVGFPYVHSGHSVCAFYSKE